MEYRKAQVILKAVVSKNMSQISHSPVVFSSSPFIFVLMAELFDLFTQRQEFLSVISSHDYRDNKKFSLCILAAFINIAVIFLCHVQYCIGDMRLFKTIVS